MESTSIELDVNSDKTLKEMQAERIQDTGKVPVWDNRTGQKSMIQYGDDGRMLAYQLRKRRPEDGSLAFTDKDPGIKLKVGTLLCPLHKDGPNRDHYDTLGFPICNKSNLPNQTQVDQYMNHRYKVENLTIEKEKAEYERQEDRNMQKKMIQALAGAKTLDEQAVEKIKVDLPKDYIIDDLIESKKPPVYVSDKDKAAMKAKN